MDRFGQSFGAMGKVSRHLPSRFQPLSGLNHFIFRQIGKCAVKIDGAQQLV
jgi:hypothetical protein